MRSSRGTVRARRPQGVILYRGPSLLTGNPIVCVATGLARPSRNPKTGPAIQTYILAYSGENPVEANRSGGDAAVCGRCPHRDGTCYVNLTHAPLSVYRAVVDDNYSDFDLGRHAALFKGRFLRLGAYGDPAAVPLAVWRVVCGLASFWTGYTHQWESCSSDYAEFCMASVETPTQREQVMALGYRTFRVRIPGQRLERGEFVCPASAEAGRRLTCEECKACSGARSSDRNATPAIYFHRSSIAGNRTLRLYEAAVARIQAEEEKVGRRPLPLVG